MMRGGYEEKHEKEENGKEVEQKWGMLCLERWEVHGTSLPVWPCVLKVLCIEAHMSGDTKQEVKNYWSSDPEEDRHLCN